jgi:hypothetical protein
MIKALWNKLTGTDAELEHADRAQGNWAPVARAEERDWASWLEQPPERAIEHKDELQALAARTIAAHRTPPRTRVRHVERAPGAQPAQPAAPRPRTPIAAQPAQHTTFAPPVSPVNAITKAPAMAAATVPTPAMSGGLLDCPTEPDASSVIQPAQQGASYLDYLSPEERAIVEAQSAPAPQPQPAMQQPAQPAQPHAQPAQPHAQPAQPHAQPAQPQAQFAQPAQRKLTRLTPTRSRPQSTAHKPQTTARKSSARLRSASPTSSPAPTTASASPTTASPTASAAAKSSLSSPAREPLKYKAARKGQQAGRAVRNTLRRLQTMTKDTLTPQQPTQEPIARKRTWTDAVKTYGEHLTEEELLILRGQMA